MPLARRFSNSSQGSFISLPSTINSSTHVTAEKAEKMLTRRRKTRQQTRKELADNKKKNADKENSKNSRSNNKVPGMQSPTPYWKGERGFSFLSFFSSFSKKNRKKNTVLA